MLTRVPAGLSFAPIRRTGDIATWSAEQSFGHPPRPPRRETAVVCAESRGLVQTGSHGGYVHPQCAVPRCVEAEDLMGAG